MKKTIRLPQTQIYYKKAFKLRLQINDASKCNSHTQLVIKMLTELGWKISFKKSIITPVQTLTSLEYIMTSLTNDETYEGKTRTSWTKVIYPGVALALKG